MEHPFEQRSEEWFAVRKGKVTASMAAACLGLSPEHGPFYAYQEIIGAHKTTERYGCQGWGIEKEQTARESFERQTGLPVRVCGFHVHHDHPWLGASPDFLCGDSAGGEIKCPVKNGIPDSIPIHHRIQCLINLAATGRKVWFYFVWTPTKDRLWVVKPAGTEGLIRRLKAWYDKHVVPGVPPARSKRRKKAKLRPILDAPPLMDTDFPFERPEETTP